MKTKLTILILITSVLCVDAQSWTWSEDQLSYARVSLTASVLDDSIFYSGGGLSWGYSFSNTVDIYDVGDDVWSSVTLESTPRWGAISVAAGDKVFIAGGNNYPASGGVADVDIYNKATNSWSVDSLSLGRSLFGGAVACGDKVFFAGGLILINNATLAEYTNVIDIYDLETETWSVDTLSSPRGLISAAVVGNKVYFAGGATGNLQASDTIDIYDVVNDEWTMEYLSEPRAAIAAVTFDNEIYFAGGTRPAGSTCTVIDVYDTDEEVWKDPIYLSIPRIRRAMRLNDALVFAGMCNYILLEGAVYIGPASGIMDIYYPNSGQWANSVPPLNPARVFYADAVYKDKAYIAGGSPTPGGAPIATIDILKYNSGQIHVPGDYLTIREGINAATHGDTVLVDEGTYYENINFMGKAITVASQYIMDGDESHIENTIIDGSQPANPDSASVVSFISGEDTTSIITGFTITGGSGTPSSWGDGFSGGGIYCAQSGAKIENNNIVDNHCEGGGDFMSGGGIFTDTCYNRSVIIRNNLVSENSCVAIQSATQSVTGGGMSILIDAVITGNTIKNNFVYHGAGGQALGGGIEGYLSKCIIKNNTIKDNIIENTGNSYQPNGCGIYLQQTQEGTIISGNLITGNQGLGYISIGGGIATWNNEGELIIDNNIIENNDACRGSGLRLGIYSNVVEITNNVIRNNSPSAYNTSFSRGGGIYITEASADSKSTGRIKYRDTEKNSTTNLILSKNLLNVIANNNLLNNSSIDGGGIFVKTAIDNLLAFNNIFQYNSASSQGDAIFLLSNTHMYVYHNNIDPNDISGTGNWEGEGNIFVDPEFDDDGYHLLPGSQCIEAGITEIEIGGDTYYCPEFDIDGQPRPLNVTADIGVDEVLITGIYDGNISQNNSELQISPNPFSGTTHLRFTIYEQGFTICDLYDISGVKVKQLLNKEKTIGTYEMEIDLSDLPNGVYFITLKMNKGTQTTKMIKL